MDINITNFFGTKDKRGGDFLFSFNNLSIIKTIFKLLIKTSNLYEIFLSVNCKTVVARSCDEDNYADLKSLVIHVLI